MYAGVCWCNRMVGLSSEEIMGGFWDISPGRLHFPAVGQLTSYEPELSKPQDVRPFVLAMGSVTSIVGGSAVPLRRHDGVVSTEEIAGVCVEEAGSELEAIFLAVVPPAFKLLRFPGPVYVYQRGREQVFVSVRGGNLQLAVVDQAYDVFKLVLELADPQLSMVVISAVMTLCGDR